MGVPPTVLRFPSEYLMASKSFYTLDEAAKRLGKTASEINGMADKGLLQRVNHEGQIKFRVEQVEVLASDEDAVDLNDDMGPIGLADSGSAAPISAAPARKAPTPLDDSVLGLAGSASGAPSFGAGDSGERTGISAVSNRGKGDNVEIGLETVGSGSGLLDLTRDSDETALGAELMDQVYSNDSGGSQAGSSGIFAAAAMETPEAQAPIATGMMVAEAYDGAWSGVGVGLMVAAAAAVVVVAVIMVTAVAGNGSLVATNITSNLLAWVGSLGGLVAVFGLLGFFIGRATE
ncbi:MAG: hypothetical protein RL354_2078 [Planctomycetota bacterium]|jgi:hypothetical protein